MGTKRKIIEIDEELCNGCGDCIVGCAEGALQLIDGKAKLVRDDFCDGFGDCVGACPTGALKIIERDAADFDVEAVKDNLKKTEGEEAVKKMEEAHRRHNASHSGGCPGMRAFSIERKEKVVTNISSSVSTLGSERESKLTQWPIQIHLVSPQASYFNGRELVVMNTCGPLASADVHERYLEGRSVVVGCPKLDRTESYADKLAQIIENNDIPKVIIVRMEVPCCGGLTQIIQAARENIRRSDVVFEEHTLSIQGELIGIKRI